MILEPRYGMGSTTAIPTVVHIIIHIESFLPYRR